MITEKQKLIEIVNKGKVWPVSGETLPRNMNPFVMNGTVKAIEYQPTEYGIGIWPPVETGVESTEQRTLDDFDPATLGEQPPY